MAKWWEEIEDTVESVVDTAGDYSEGMRAIYTGDFGRGRKELTQGGLRAGELTGLIDEPKKTKTPTPTVEQGPTREQANLDALAGQRDMLKKRRASRTLFGGGGMLDQSPSASSILLGV